MYSLFLHKKNQYILFFLYFIAVFILLIFTNHTFLGVQDEAQLYATLKEAEPINYMTSYPLALLGGYLYTHFPDGQWYSIIMSFFILVIIILMSFYTAVIQFQNSAYTIIIKVLLLFFFTFLLMYILLEVNVTSSTLIIVLLAIPLIPKHQLYFWFLLWMASFLREQIIFSLLPLLAMAYLIGVEKKYFSNRRTALILVFLVAILFNHFSYKLNPTYAKWMEFTEKRAYFTDFGGAPKGNILTPDEYHLARSWWIVDQDIYPYKKVMRAAGSTIDILETRFTQINLHYYILRVFNDYPVFFLLFLLSFILAFLHKSLLKAGGYLLFGSIFIALIIVKNVDRVTFPLLILWWVMILTDLWYLLGRRYKNTIYIAMATIILYMSYMLYQDIPWQRLTQYQQRENLANELRTVLKKNHIRPEITTGFPSSWEYLIEAIMENHLFDEKHWIDYNDDLLLQGWFSRVPLVYKQHHVSFDGIMRKYPHYHDWLISTNAGIVGSKGKSTHKNIFLLKNILRIYDEKYPRDGCYHQVVILDESEHFIMQKIREVCSDFSRLEKIWDYKDDINSTQLKNMKISDGALQAFNNDPQILMTSSKVEDGYIILELDIESDKKTTLQMFYKYKSSNPFSEFSSQRIAIHKGRNHIYRVLPAKYLKHTLRIDPVEHEGIYRINEFSIYRYLDRDLSTSPESNISVQQIK